jgi:hypothetical protein
MAQAPELTSLDKAYSSARPRKEIAPAELLGLLGRAVSKASDSETSDEMARDVARRALALAESISGDVEKSDDAGAVGLVGVDAEIFADVEKDAEGADHGSRSFSGMLTELRKRLGVADPADAAADGDADPAAAADVDKGADDDADLFSADLNEDPAFAIDAADGNAADADE